MPLIQYRESVKNKILAEIWKIRLWNFLLYCLHHILEFHTFRKIFKVKV